VRGGAVSVSSLVQTQHRMARSAIELEKRPLDTVGNLDELIQDRFGVRGSPPLIGKSTTKMPNRPRACRLVHKVSIGCPQGVMMSQRKKKKR
jgi:hypothetical protein